MNYKNYIPLLLLVILTIISCNKKDNTSPDNQMPDTTTGSGYMAVEKGMKLTYTVAQGDASGNSYIWHVTNVNDSAGYKIAHSELLFDGGITVHANGRYNGAQTIMLGSEMPPVYYQLLTQMQRQFNVSFVHNEYPVNTIIPHKNQVGVIVAPEQKTAEWHGKGADGNLTIQQDYVVKRSKAIIDSLDHITTSIGEFDCVRYRYKTTTENKITTSEGGTSEMEYESNTTVWVALGLGIIKTTDVSAASVNTTELTKIERK